MRLIRNQSRHLIAEETQTRNNNALRSYVDNARAGGHQMSAGVPLITCLEIYDVAKGQLLDCIIPLAARVS